jgi:predicted nucleotidyltransferase component of viral defense system
MAFRDVYRSQVELLLRVLPLVSEEEVFALKGGTAINLFVRDMPRLSVDIDLTYLPVQPRAESLAAISEALQRISDHIERRLPESRVTPQWRDGLLTKLFVEQGGVRIKVEVTPVTRGVVYPARIMAVSETVQDAFGFAETRVVSSPDLYAGKLVAALDRQHPRDLFDVRELLAHEGIDVDMRRAFVAYMLSHNRPMAEVLRPRLRDIKLDYERGFVGMTEDAVPLESILEARGALIANIVGSMPDEHRRFLLGFKRGEPDWSLLGLPDVAELPAVKWRQQNLDGMAKEKRAAQVGDLAEALGLTND